MKNERTTLTADQFARYQIHYPCNSVIVRIDEQEVVTKAGLRLDFNKETLYAEGTESHVADMATVMGTIVKQPERLFFHPKSMLSLSWECDIETLVGDVVWSHPLNVKNCDEIMVEGQLYQVWNYEDLFCAKRGDEVIALNGNLILEPIYKPKTSEFDVSPPELDKERAIVRFIGTPNKRYQAKGLHDIQGVEVGDTVLIDKNTYIIWLERFSHNANFDNGNMYYAIQGRHILAVI